MTVTQGKFICVSKRHCIEIVKNNKKYNLCDRYSYVCYDICLCEH